MKNVGKKIRKNLHVVHLVTIVNDVKIVVVG